MFRSIVTLLDIVEFGGSRELVLEMEYAAPKRDLCLL